MVFATTNSLFATTNTNTRLNPRYSKPYLVIFFLYHLFTFRVWERRGEETRRDELRHGEDFL